MNEKSKVSGHSEMKENSKGTKMSSSSKFFNILIQLMLLVISSTIIYRTLRDAGFILYSLHPIFNSIGYIILMTHGVLVMADNNIFSLKLNYQKRVTTHWVLQLLALVLITVAQSAIFVNKDINGWPHYQSIHSLFGLATYLLTVAATLGGVLTKYSSKLKNLVKPTMLKIGHSFAGIFVYILSIVTIFLGINQSWLENNDFYIKFFILFTFVITTIYVVNKSFKTAVSRFSEISNKIKK